MPAVHARQARDQMQAPQTGTAAIAGVILTDEATPQPIKRAQVIVINAESAFSRTAYTNDAGRFSLDRPAGRTLHADGEQTARFCACRTARSATTARARRSR